MLLMVAGVGARLAKVSLPSRAHREEHTLEEPVALHRAELAPWYVGWELHPLCRLGLEDVAHVEWPPESGAHSAAFSRFLS